MIPLIPIEFWKTVKIPRIPTYIYGQIPKIMPQDYRDVVLANYVKKKDEGSLSPNLLNPTPGSLRSECLIVYRERYDPKDDEILRLFFGGDDNEKGYYKIIENNGSDKFKQLPKILNQEIVNPGIKFIELLAWLIDFKPRASTAYYKSFYEKNTAEPIDKKNANTDGVNSNSQDFNKTNSLFKTESPIAEVLTSKLPTETINEPNDKPTVPVVLVLDTNEARASDAPKDFQNTGDAPKTLSQDENKATRKRLKDHNKTVWSTSKMIIWVTIIIFVGAGSILFWQDRKNRETISADEKCMYWVGDHYEAIVCDKETITPKITLNIEKLKRLKKINTPDKLTKYDLGKVWYAKIYNKVEFYTDSGMHPIDTNRVLRPLTDYMLKTHTSYYRYLLNLLFWAMGGIGLSWLLIAIARKYLLFK